MTGTSHTWKFFRLGGLDQVSIQSTEDLLNLHTLDQKLWVALSCPVKGLEIDEASLSLIDSDKDGRIRVPELFGVIKWLALRLKDPGFILKPGESLPVEQIHTGSPEGAALLASIRQILAAAGKAEAVEITVSEALNPRKALSGAVFNGDGVIGPEMAKDESVAAVLKDILACLGADKDCGGGEGVTAAKVDTFFADLAAHQTWLAGAEAAKTLGEGTAAAAAAIQALKVKIDDYFTRCRLASFDLRSTSVLNRSEGDFAALSGKELTCSAAEIAAFPLAKVDAEASLPLLGGVNPAWSAALATLQKDAVTPVFGTGKRTLSESEWQTLQAKVQPWLAWQAGKAGASVEKLGAARIAEILASDAKQALSELIAKDAAAAAHFTALDDVEKLLRLRRDFGPLLRNFVNFFDFYSTDTLADFQAGTLYLDSRSTELCVRVAAPNPLAVRSKVFIAYCACTRPGEAPINIAACFTQGDSDFLFAGRRGVFYDRKGQDWDAVITSIVDNPISVRQAFWSPYKKFVNFVEEQVAKRASAADAAATGKLAAAAEKTANADKAKPAEAPKKFDLALITGIGVALGSIGGFLAAVFAKLIELQAWQLPLVFLAVILAISTPSMIIAWLKLRQRNLGPILEGNGWAVNGRVMINIPFGTALTDRAVLPANARRTVADPYQDNSGRRARRMFLLVVLLALVGYAASAWHLGMWPFKPAEESATPAAPASESAPAAPAPAAPSS